MRRKLDYTQKKIIYKIIVIWLSYIKIWGLIILNFFKSFLKGVAIGAGAILPGISSGVLCVIFGIYEKLLNCVLNFFKNIKYNLKYLYPIMLGTFFGIWVFGNVLKYVFYAYPVQTKFIFIGLILGSIPELMKKACSKEEFEIKDLFYLIISFLIGIGLVLLESELNLKSDNNEFSIIYIILSGFLMSAGVIIPGVSSTLILMLMGIYDAYLISISKLYLPFLVPLAVGLVIGSILCMKLIKFLLDKFYTKTFFCIIGFTIGSVFVLYPGFTWNIEGLSAIVCLILGFSVISLN